MIFQNKIKCFHGSRNILNNPISVCKGNQKKHYSTIFMLFFSIASTIFSDFV